MENNQEKLLKEEKIEEKKVEVTKKVDILKEVVAEKELTEKDLFNKIGVKNFEGFESFLEMSFEKPKLSPSFLEDSFRYIYEARSKETYNPIEERYMLHGAIASAIYGFDLEIISLMSKVFGAFKTVFLLEKYLNNKEEAEYFKQLYKDYVNNKESLTTVIKEGIVELALWLEQQAGKINIEDLQKIAKEFALEAEKVRKI